jgi:hypothetical protein
MYAYQHEARRNENMRKARNAAFYRDNSVTATSQQAFRKDVSEFVQKARAENRYLIRIFKRWH